MPKNAKNDDFYMRVPHVGQCPTLPDPPCHFGTLSLTRKEHQWLYLGWDQCEHKWIQIECHYQWPNMGLEVPELA